MTNCGIGTLGHGASIHSEFVICNLLSVIPNELKASSASRWSGLNRRPAHYECAALPLSYTGGLRNKVYRLPKPLRQADARVARRAGRAKTRLRKAYVAARFSKRDKTPGQGRAKRWRRVGAPRVDHLSTSSRAGFEPRHPCGNIHGGPALSVGAGRNRARFHPTSKRASWARRVLRPTLVFVTRMKPWPVILVTDISGI